MYTDQQIKKLVSKLDNQQIKNILSEFYLNAGNSIEVINKLFNNSYNLKHDLESHIINENIDMITVLLEINN
jgi:hypothetical protein|tara:strand:+ start:312 stop:527 length:216 start_codon:yes stop_codon:yes gene_type:complete